MRAAIYASGGALQSHLMVFFTRGSYFRSGAFGRQNGIGNHCRLHFPCGFADVNYHIHKCDDCYKCPSTAVDQRRSAQKAQFDSVFDNTVFHNLGVLTLLHRLLAPKLSDQLERVKCLDCLANGALSKFDPFFAKVAQRDRTRIDLSEVFCEHGEWHPDVLMENGATLLIPRIRWNLCSGTRTDSNSL